MVPDIPGVDQIVGRLIGGAAGSVFDGIIIWMARGLAMLIEWIWSTLDSATTPHLTEDWFRHDLLGPIVTLALAVTVAMMLASGIQAALAGRPEQILDAFKQGAWSLAATALAITVMDLLIGIVDQASAGIWNSARGDLQHLLEGVIAVMQSSALSGMGFLAVLMLLFMYLALIGLAIALAMRNALIYVTAALAPIVFSSSVLPTFRESARKIVHLAVSLIVSKLAIVITLTMAVKLMANATNITTTGDAVQDGVGALGVLFAGVVCFAVASMTPIVLYRMMPTVEHAVVGAGIAGGFGRGAMTGMYAASSAKSLGGSLARLATKPTPGDSDAEELGDTGPAGTGPTGAGGPQALAGAGSSGSASGASGSSAAAGGASGGAAAAGAVAIPVAVAEAGVQAFTSGVSAMNQSASATASAASAEPASASSAETSVPTTAGETSPTPPRNDSVADRSVPNTNTGEES